MSGDAIVFKWSGEVMIPHPAKLEECRGRFTPGHIYRLEEIEDRSMAAHRYYFAAINTAWQNLPDDLLERYPSAEHLRKHALIRAGYCDSRTLVASSKAEAQRIAAFLRPAGHELVVVREAVVVVYTAVSQSVKAMGKREFYESIEKVLDAIAQLLGTTKDALVEASRAIAA